MGPFAEFDNVAELSKYPFSDSSSMKSDTGYVLPTDFLLDISMCIRTEGVPYLSSISYGVCTFSVAGTAVAYFGYSGPGTVQVFESSTGRSCGIAVLGKSAMGFESLQFGRNAARLCPSCFCTFFRDKPVMSLSDGSTKLAGNVRLTGKNGVYVTLVGKDTFRIDIVGDPEEPVQCASPVRRVVVIGRDCPVIAGVPMQYPGTDNGFVPGVIAVRSKLSADDVCGGTEQFVQPDGTLGTRSCDPDPPATREPLCLEDSGPGVVYPANGNIDIVPFHGDGEPTSPVEVETVKTGAEAVPVVSSMSDPSMKNLADVSGSGTVVLKLKGKH